ncbi:MAG: hypothetical protein FWD03_01110 [Defluviitaleaceae bacterium]|nr:hypothetical protein [Defluviitaleaceae bacterium]
MSQLSSFLFAAIAIEGIIFYAKTGIENKMPKSCVASIILGVFVAINFDIDVFEYSSLHSALPLVGNILTGMLLSRGSNYFFDMIGNLSR